MSAFPARRESAEAIAPAAHVALLRCWAILDEIRSSIWPTEENAWLVAEELELYRRGTRLGGPFMAVACFAVAQACAHWIAGPTRWAWAIGAAAITLAIYAASLRYSRASVTALRDIRAWAVCQTVLITIYTIAWCSMSVFLWAPGVLVNHMFIVLLLAASLAGSITMSASHPATAAIAIIVHAAFLIVPPALSRAPLDHTLAVLSPVFVILLTSQAVALHLSMRRMLTLEHERSDLVEGLKLAKQESDGERARAIAAGRAKSQFLSNMNHELRTPMNAILGFSELIKQKAFGDAVDKYAEYAEIIHESGQNLLGMIDDMLDLAKIEAGKLSLRESEIGLAELMGSLFADNEAKAAEAQLSLLQHVPPGLPRIYADERALRQIIANLLSNALKFTPAGGCVTLFAHVERDGRLAFGVDDTGIGIAEEEQAHVFERFGRGRHDVTSADKGTGIGLAIVKGFAEAHDGEVRLESSLGNGTRVTALLPAERVRAHKMQKAG